MAHQSGRTCSKLSYHVVVRVFLDADATIKLHRCGVLANLVGAFSCTMPQAVYDEVVTMGKARLHQDADSIERTIRGTVTVLPTVKRHEPALGLGAGELGILDLLAEETDPLVVSDDRRFLTLLTAQRIPFLTPADMLVLLARRGVLNKTEANEALRRLRPLIRSAAYQDASQDLNPGGKR